MKKVTNIFLLFCFSAISLASEVKEQPNNVNVLCQARFACGIKVCSNISGQCSALQTTTLGQTMVYRFPNTVKYGYDISFYLLNSSD